MSFHGFLAFAMTASSSTYPTTIVVGLNGALQKRFMLPNTDMLVAGNVHRATSVQTGVGGKGQDVAIALHCLEPGQENLHLAQFVGRGFTGDAVYRLLVEQLGESAMDLTVRSLSEMRTCTSIVACDETTELVEPSGSISENELASLMTKISRFKNLANAICIMGSLPPGCPPEVYSQIFGTVAGSGTVCIVDSVTGIDELIKKAKEMDATAGRIVFKINASELCKLTGTSKSNNETGGIGLSELTDAVDGFVERYSPHTTKSMLGLAVTDGRHPAFFVSMTGDKAKQLPIIRIFRLEIAKLESGRNLYPIGAGDAVAAGTLAAWVSLVRHGYSWTSSSSPSACPIIPPECLELLIEHTNAIRCDCSLTKDVAQAMSAFRFGLVCGSASCLQEENSVLLPTDVKDLLQRGGMPELILSLPFCKS